MAIGSGIWRTIARREALHTVQVTIAPGIEYGVEANSVVYKINREWTNDVRWFEVELSIN